jgi:hypothetical protein
MNSTEALLKANVFFHHTKIPDLGSELNLLTI